MNPLALLAADRAAARDTGDPMADLCVLATATAAGVPAARTLVLRDIEDQLALFTSATSPKADELTLTPTVALVVYLPSRSVQYRLTAVLRAVPAAIVHASWQQRPAPAKALDWLYQTHPQSTDIRDRDTLLAALESAPRPDPLVAPTSAEGFYVDVLTIDRLDLDTADGVHDRRRFWLNDGTWHERTVVP